MKASADSEPTIADRYKAGAALRHILTRSNQAGWDCPSGRPSPVSILVEQGKSRLQNLLPERYRRMSGSAFTFFRGAAAIMAQDLSAMPATGIRLQSCGDAHLMNFGTFASPEAIPTFDINDFDETLQAPFEWDIKRLATSMILAGHEAGMKKSACQALARRSATAYRLHVGMLASLTPLEAWSNRIDLRQAIAGIDSKSARQHAEKRLAHVLEDGRSGYGLALQEKDGSWHIAQKPPLVQKLTPDELHVEAAFARYGETLREEQRVLYARYRLRDVALKVVGVGSVGTLCAIALFTTADGAPLLLQIKEAQQSVLQRFGGITPALPAFTNQGQRVVTGQRIMQALPDSFLGWTEARVDGRQLYVRRLKDSRLASVGTEIEEEALSFTAELCGRALARAHLRSGDGAVLAGYLGGGTAFDEAIAEFAQAYAGQTETDYRSFLDAIKKGLMLPGSEASTGSEASSGAGHTRNIPSAR